MTNERARTELEQLYMSLSEEKKKALDVAFKAMEQADGEYIPKQAVLENIDQWYEDKADIEDLIVKITYIQGVAIPTTEPKTGHWKRISMDKYSEHAKYWYRCDRCGKNNLGNTDWCPNCGAKMN